MQLRIFVLLACFLVAPAFGDIMCSSGSLTSIVNTTCDISGTSNGSQFTLEFTFGTVSSEPVNGFASVNYSYNDGTQTFAYDQAWSASDFNFTPMNGGFMLSFLDGPQSNTALPLGETLDEAALPFSVTFLGNGDITGGSVSGGTFSASGTDFSSAGSLLVLSGQEAYNWGAIDDYGTVISQDRGLTNTFLSSGQGVAVPFILGGNNGNSASWNGTPTTFMFTTVFPAPEPSSVLLLFSVVTLVFASFRIRS